jgi:hypothetical protein
MGSVLYALGLILGLQPAFSQRKVLIGRCFDVFAQTLENFWVPQCCRAPTCFHPSAARDPSAIASARPCASDATGRMLAGSMREYETRPFAHWARAERASRQESARELPNILGDRRPP